MQKTKIYNVIFPLWFVWFVPPIALVGNFLINTVVILVSFLVLKVGETTGLTIIDLYKKTILKVWLFGFAADFLGASPILLPLFFGKTLISWEIETAITMNPFSNIWALLIVISCMLLASVFIFIFNYYISFRKTVKEKTLRLKLVLILAILTTPWTLLIPTEWFVYPRI